MEENVNISEWPMVARKRELEIFDELWKQSDCQGIAIYGPAGAGKSRLAEEFLKNGKRAGWEFWQVKATKSSSTIPLGAIAHIIPDDITSVDLVSIFSRIAAKLTHYGRQTRKAVWVDDLHLLDITSAVLLRQMMDAKLIRLIATIRTGEQGSKAVDALAGSSTVHRIDVSEFDMRQTAQVLTAALKAPVGRNVTNIFHSFSGGNALYIRELVNGALRVKALRYTGELWELSDNHFVSTPRLSELIEEKLSIVTPAARQALELLSLCEPLGLTDVNEVASLEDLLSLQEAGLINVEMDRRRTTVTLAHPLYAEMLRQQIPIHDQKNLIISQVNRVRVYGGRRRSDATQLAVWQLAAIGTAEPSLLTVAAGLAYEAHDYQQVVNLLEALPDKDHTCESWLLLGRGFTEIGEWEKAEAFFIKADALAWSDEQRTSIAISRSYNLFWLAGRTEDALKVNQKALLRVSSRGIIQALRINEGSMLAISGKPVLAVQSFIDLEENVRQSTNPTAWSIGAIFKPPALAMIGRSIEAIQAAEKFYGMHKEFGEIPLAPHPSSHRTSLVLALTEAGYLERARNIGEATFADLLAAQAPVPRVWVAINLARTEWLAGHLSSARQWYAEAVTLARAYGQPRPLFSALMGLAAVMAVLGNVNMAERLQKEAVSLGAGNIENLFVGEERLVEAWVYAIHGQAVQSRNTLLEAASDAREAGHVASEALLLTDLARLGGAAESVDRLEKLAIVTEGPFIKARAQFAKALAVGSPGILLGVTEALEEIGADLLAAEAAAAAAKAFRLIGEKRKAAASQQKAQVYAIRCQGAHTPLLDISDPVSPLTAREKEVALLAATGHASKEIAETLHLSVRTVDNHLQSTYTKLGVSSRQELSTALGT